MRRKKATKREKGHVAGTVEGVAVIETEARDYMWRCAMARHRAAEIKGELKVIEKRIKVVDEKLNEEMEKAVAEGGRKGQTRIEFPSLEAVELQAQSAALDHIEIGLGMCNRLQDVPLASLEQVRKGMNAAVDAAVTVKDDDAGNDGKSEAAGG